MDPMSSSVSSSTIEEDIKQEIQESPPDDKELHFQKLEATTSNDYDQFENYEKTKLVQCNRKLVNDVEILMDQKGKLLNKIQMLQTELDEQRKSDSVLKFHFNNLCGEVEQLKSDKSALEEQVRQLKRHVGMLKKRPPSTRKSFSELKSRSQRWKRKREVEEPEESINPIPEPAPVCDV